MMYDIFCAVAEFANEKVNVYCRCHIRTKEVRKVCAKHPDTDVYLSRLTAERLDRDNVIVMPAPECSFAEWDPGKVL